MMMYEDLRQEKRRQEDWKQMYFKSQIAVMSFRRRTDKIRLKLTDEEYQALVKCLEVGWQMLGIICELISYHGSHFFECYSSKYLT